ncbi:MAG TPA: LysE family transporter [Verrucomicrobiae bacterium]|jgi:threonine/homoserine/homoserine lactone efflux protein|nr:LysE family transporter [Verrucomicrobiae bacterium]
MESIHPIVRSALTGFFSALLLAIPVGPVNLTIINEGARSGRKWAMLITLGATTMEVTYCFIAFTGLASFFITGPYVKAGMELFSFVFMLVLGIKFLLAKSVSSPVELGAAASKIKARIGERLNPQTAFMTGFVRVLANPGVLVCWFVLAAQFISHHWVTPDLSGRLACVVGVGLGTASWFVILSFSSARGHGKWSDKTLLRIEHFSGIALLIFALLDGAWIAKQMVDSHRERKSAPAELRAP